MGNNCVKGKMTFFHTISHSLWWSRKKSPCMSFGMKNKKHNTPSSAAPNSNPTLTDPPEIVKIDRPDDDNDRLPQQPVALVPEVIVPKEVDPNMAVQTTTKRTKTVDKNDQPTEAKPVPVKPQKPKRPKNVVRIMSMGQKVESVLRTRTGNLKDNYNLGHKLGYGQFGTTFHCVEKETGVEYACKSIAKRKLLTQDDVDDVRREVEIMHHLSGNPSVVSIKGAYEDSESVYVVMELCAGGELFDRIVKRGHYSEKKAAELTRTVVGVIETCHSLGVMHRDLKPENFLFVGEEEDSQLKAIDFGLSIFFKPGETFSDVVGSPYYVAPEVLLKCYGPQVDVWSAGVIIYILLSGVPPFWGESQQEIFDNVLHADVDFTSDPWTSISESAKDLVKRMLERDPKKRLTAHQVLCHPWLQEEGVAPDKPLDSAVLSRLTQFSAMDKFKKIALRVIAESLSEEEIAGLKEMFKSLDTDNSGYITFEELKVGLKRYGANLQESEIHDLMNSADVDNSGTIDYGEFIAATLHLNKIEKEDYLYRAFSYFDKDGSGYIMQDELQKACAEFGIEDSHLEEMISEADQNNDGRIDYNEFVVMMQKGNSDFGKKRYQNNFSNGIRDTMTVC